MDEFRGFLFRSFRQHGVDEDATQRLRGIRLKGLEHHVGRRQRTLAAAQNLSVQVVVIILEGSGHVFDEGREKLRRHPGSPHRKRGGAKHGLKMPYPSVVRDDVAGSLEYLGGAAEAGQHGSPRKSGIRGFEIRIRNGIVIEGDVLAIFDFAQMGKEALF